jgi:MarC family membrane protein
MAAVVYHFTHVFFLVYAGLFPIVNPVGNAPIFLALTRDCTDRERHALALRVAIDGFFLLLGSLLVGSYVLEFFGITLPVLRIAGGVVVTAFGWTLLQAREDLEDQRIAEGARGPDAATDAFYPLTMPLTVGPGAISVAIALGSERPKEESISLISRCSPAWPLPASLPSLSQSIFATALPSLPSPHLANTAPMRWCGSPPSCCSASASRSSGLALASFKAPRLPRAWCFEGASHHTLPSLRPSMSSDDMLARQPRGPARSRTTTRA